MSKTDIYHLDFETYSGADIKSFGGYRYAADESTEILIMAIAKNDEEPLVWSVQNLTIPAVMMLRQAVLSGAEIYAHNAQFEAAICKYLLKKTFNIDPPKLTQWRCTAAMARRAAIPSSLAGAGEFLNIEKAKDKSGAALIRKFSIPKKATKKDPRTRIFPDDDPADFANFVAYCKQDVEAERQIHKKLKAFELKDAVLESFQFDLEMNDRGVPVNVDALQRVDKLINEYTDRLTNQFIEITGFKPSQYDECLEYFRARGYPFDNLVSDNVEVVLENGASGWEQRFVEWGRFQEMLAHVAPLGCPLDSKVKRKRWLKDNAKQIPPKFTVKEMQPVNMDEQAFQALRIRSNVSHAAVKKVPTMLGAVCPDGFVRGSLMWSGAERTHRWAGRIIQPQNFKRSTKSSMQAYKMFCEGMDIDTTEMLFGDFLEVVAHCIRHFIHWNGGELLQADFSSVEARGAPWLCGGHKKLAMFKRGEPIYETMAAKIFGCPVQQVIDEDDAGDSEKRFIGKQAELGCTYNMGRPKFRGTCELYKYKPSSEMVEAFKPRFFRMMKKAELLCQNPEPWGEFEIKFPSFQWMQPRNLVKNRNFVKRGFTVWAYRPDGTRRAVKDWKNATPQEWVDLTFDDLADRAVTTWREDNPEIVEAWKTLDKAAKDAIRHPGKVFKGSEKITFGVSNAPGFRALIMKLPSGHTLIYPKAKLVWKGEPPREGEQIDWSDGYNTEIQFWGKIPGKSTWGWCKTYGGKLLENATQGICGDFMANGAVEASRHNYHAFMLVHDELIGPCYEGQTHETLCKLLCTLPSWAAGMPLDADGATIPFYKK